MEWRGIRCAAAPCRRVVCAAAVALAALAGPAQAGGGDPLRGEQWGVDAVRGDAARAVADGSGVLVAVVDSGVDASHPDLAGSVVAGPDLVDGDSDPNDANGHGTHVAGIIAAHAGNGIGIAGLAPGAKVLAVRVLDANKSGDTDRAAQGIDAAVAAGARVINLSLTAGPDAQTILPTSAIVQAIDRAAKAGVVVVAAAGNDALPVCEQPIVQERTLCVGGVDDSLQRSSFSNYGLRVDLVAPAGSPTHAIVSTVPGGYGEMAGTSQAAPFVSAAAADLISQGLTGTEAIDRILATTRDLGPAGPDATYGNGLLDMQAAVGAPDLPAAPAITASETVPVPRPAAPALSASARARIRTATFLRDGLRVRCRSSRSGRCSAVLTDAAGRTLGRGSRLVAAGRATTLLVRVTATGGRALRTRPRRAARLTVRGPGGVSATRRLLLRA